MTTTALGWIEPDWPAPAHVRVVSTLRGGGVGSAPFDTLNLAAHVGDRPEAVAANRLLLAEAAHLPAEPLWLTQVHGTEVVTHDGRSHVGELARAEARASGVRADAAVAFEPGRVCVVMTADCLPVVLADRTGTRIGIAHAGWRGLAGGVVEATIAALGAAPQALHAWLGPAIGPRAFEVGAEVRATFVQRDPAAASCFEPNAAGRFQADLYALARCALARAGVASVHGGLWCTHGDRERFFSYRRDGVTGRMATLAWLA